MSYKIVLLALVALQAGAALALPPCVCTRNLQPVCGSDGQTYSNRCMLDCERFNGKRDLQIARPGPCNASDVQRLHNEGCICTLEYKPVCGTDGKTYPNGCVLDCERSNNPDIAVKSQGACVDEAKPTETIALKIADPCTCGRLLTPVCGSDGKTYSNPCRLDCARHKGQPDLVAAKSGPCDSEASKPECIITKELHPVCGTDGKTYPNPSQLHCAAADIPNLDVKHEGECVTDNVANTLSE